LCEPREYELTVIGQVSGQRPARAALAAGQQRTDQGDKRIQGIVHLAEQGDDVGHEIEGAEDAESAA
jgi:hypothetical protein